MNWKINLMTLFVGAILFVSCEKQDTPDFEERDLVLTEQEKEVISLGNEFAFTMFDQLSKDITADENLFFSPLSVGAALTMTSNGAKGETLEQMLKALNIDGIDAEQVNAYYKKLITELPYLNRNTTINIANSIWYKDDFDVLGSFLAMNQNYFNAEIAALDFTSPQALNKINGWVNEKNQTKIPTILENIPADAVMYLINAIYFKGAWDYKFDKSKTKKDNFKKANGSTIEADFMEVEHTFNISSSNGYQAVQLPYTDQKFDMIIVKSQDGVSLGDLKTTLQNPTAVRGLVEGFSGANLRLHLPKFKTSYESSLNNMLKAFGMVTPFSDVADFTGITEGGGIKISEVKHKAFVEVNEEGTEAAAVTSIGMVLTSAQPGPFVVKFDEPFLFLIREASSGLILFAGQVNDPTVEETKK